MGKRTGKDHAFALEIGKSTFGFKAVAKIFQLG
jgi:hypothetical protein